MNFTWEQIDIEGKSVIEVTVHLKDESKNIKFHLEKNILAH